MKKAFILLILLSAQMIFAVVNTRLVYVSNTHNFPSAGLSTLVFDVEAISDAGDVLINLYQNAVQLDANFIAQNPTVSFSNQLFSLAAYNTTHDYSSSAGRIRFIYTYNTGTKGTINGTYTRVVTISIQYTTAPSTGSINWFSGIPNYSVNDGNNQLITGTRLTIPTELNSIPLPVELTSFTSKFLNDKIQLNWITKTEVNNYGFNVERRINEGEWNNIGFVEGHGNSNSPKSYSFTDKSPVGGSKFQYRLKQIDTDGKFEYSDEIEVEIIPIVFALYQNYPNPFNPNTKIRYQLPKESKVVIKIYDILGAEVISLLNEKKEPGIYEVELNAQSLPSGIYIYRIIAKDFVGTKKMVLMK